jgi:hypothetical protein
MGVGVGDGSKNLIRLEEEIIEDRETDHTPRFAVNSTLFPATAFSLTN